MIVTLSSERFLFRTGTALAYPTTGKITKVIEGSCDENVISGLDVSWPGQYNLWLSNFEVRVLPREQVIAISSLVRPWTIEFTGEDLRNGRKTFVVPSGGIFRISVFDGDGTAVPFYKLLAYQAEMTASNPSETTVEIQMGSDGTRLVYGDPMQCQIRLDVGYGLLIEHLDPRKTSQLSRVS